MRSVSTCNECVSSYVKKATLVLGAMMGVFLICLPLFSQGSQGTIQGGVFDQSGGAIASATVTVIDVARGVTRALTTDSAGEYVAINLTPGTYTVRADARGFRTVEHSGVLVEVGQNIRVDLVVQPGEQTQTITVSGEVPEVNTTDATLGGAISNQEVNALPLNGRNFLHLIQLRPGVISPIGSSSGQESTNGRRRGNDSLVLEGIAQIAQSGSLGVTNSSYTIGDTESLLPIDSIQEFNTEQNPEAEFGWKDGSIVTVGVKSGTNNLHGTAYAFGRDASATDARNAFIAAGPNSITPSTLEQFGGSLGGRIVKDKLFWFMSYEGLRSSIGDVVVDTIPSDVAGPGASNSMVDACNALNPTHAPLGSAANKINPLSAQLSGLNPTTCVVTPASSTVENLFPYNPNASTSFPPGLLSTTPLNNGVIKGDYVPGPHHHLSGMYYTAQQTQASYSGGQLLPQWGSNIKEDTTQYDGSWTWTPNSTWVNEVRLGYVYYHNVTLPDDINSLPSNPWPNGYSMNTGVTNPLYSGLPEIQISTFTGYLGTGGHESFRGPEGDVSFKDSVSYLRGRHSFRFGFEYVDVVFDGDSFSVAQGDVKFSTLSNFLQGIPQNGSIVIGNPEFVVRSHWYAPFFQDDWRVTKKIILNLGLRWEYYAPPTEQGNYIGNFDPNVNPATTPAVQQVGPGQPIPAMYNANKADFSPRLGVAWDVRGNGKTVVRAGASVLRASIPTGLFIYNVPFGANFPSIGVNYSGTALNAHTPLTLALSGCGTSVCPGSFAWNLAGPVFPISGTQVINGATYSGITCAPSAAPWNGTPCSTNAVDPNIRESYTAEWNVDIQRAITNNLTLDVAYVGNHGFDEPNNVDLNEPPIGAGWAGTATTNCINSAPAYNNCKANTAAEVGQYSSKFPYLNYIIELSSGDFSSYNGLQVTARERVSHGLSFIAGYTYAYAFDMFSTNGGFSVNTDLNNLRLDYGPSNSDIRHNFTFAPIYLVPGIKSPGQMLQGWSVSPIVTLQSGAPWFASDTTHDLNGTGEYNNKGFQYWNYTGPVSAFTSGPHAIPCYGTMSGCISTLASAPASIQTECMTAAEAPYAGNAQLQQLALASLTNLGCYVQGGGVLTPPAYGTVGDASRNLFRGPNYYNVDFSVAKTWKFKERYSAQFRAEFFNLFNRADFAIPGVTNPSSGSGGQFGCSCTTPDSSNPVLGSGGPRHIQFGLKLIF